MLTSNMYIFGLIGFLALTLLAIKISKNPFWGLTALVFFLPFERIPTIEVADFTLKINHIIGLLLILFWVLDLAFSHKKIKSAGIGGVLLFFILALFLSFANTKLPARSIIYFLLDTFAVLIFFATSQLIDSKEKLTQIQTALFWGAGIALGFGFFQFIGDMIGLPLSVTGLDPGYSKMVFGFPRIQAFSREPLYFGNYLLLVLGFVMANIGLKSSALKPRALFPLLAILIVSMILTMSRGALLGLVFFFLVWCFLNMKKIITPKIITHSSVLLIIFAIGFGLLFSFLGKDLKDTFIGHISVADLSFGESTQGRLLAYEKAISAFKTAPIIGIGIGNYGAFTAGFDLDSPDIKNIVNNEYIELLAENGIVGLAGFLVFIIYIFWRSALAIRITQDDGLKNYLVALSIALMAILLQYNFFSTLSILHIWVAMGVVVGAQNIAFANSKLQC